MSTSKRSGNPPTRSGSKAAKPSKANDRARAAKALGRVLAGGDPDALLADETPLVRQTCYGSLRRLPSLRAHLAVFMSKPLRPADRDVECLLLVGAYQLTEMQQPDYAVVNDCVDAAKRLGKPWARGLLNAVLRRCVGTTLDPDERSFDHSQWLFKAIRRDYPERWRAVLEANNSRAPMWLRVNTSKTTLERYAASLAEAGIETEQGAYPEALQLRTPRSVSDLPGHETGEVSVQDHSAQAIARTLHGWLASRAGGLPKHLLDACAAPGGKAFHLAELCGSDTEISALEIDAERLAHMQREAKRLGHSEVRLIQGDAAGSSWSSSEASPSEDRRYDFVLCDAPCSGTGTLRRHPDIKVRRRSDDVARVSKLQLELLNALWQRLEPGATLAYCTCSILSNENDAVLREFTSTCLEPDAWRIERAPLPWGHATELGWQTLPGEAGGDGFYLALITRNDTRVDTREATQP